MHQQIQVIDSHTAGEPTRVVLDGFPKLGNGPLSERLATLQSTFDQFRATTVREPRGSDVLVGALLCEPQQSNCDAGVIFFNNVGYLGMCGHGLIGVAQTLVHLRRATAPQTLRIETPVGEVRAAIQTDGSVSISNVESFRKAKDVSIAVDELGTVIGDVAWGGNWFFLTSSLELDLDVKNVTLLQSAASRIRTAVNAQGFPEVDHVEIFGSPKSPEAHSRNFVLCPGLEYDRSPCGTGTSAKLACLAADGKLEPNSPWVQEGILGTAFTGQFEWADTSKGTIHPTITGRAFITGESTLCLDERDPFQWGIG